MLDSRPALFQAVIDRPSDDAPRHAYAGYCEAQGDPYGAFIRAQLARTEALRHGTDNDAARWYAEAQRLEAAHRDPSWFNGVDKLVREARLIRGFVDKVALDARDYLQHAAELHRRAPIRQLRLNDAGDLADELARQPQLAQVVALSFDGKQLLGDAGLAAIAGSPHLRSLRALDIAHQGITNAGMHTLAASRALPALVYVAASDKQLDRYEEPYGHDWATSRIVPEPGNLPPLGKALEAKYGELPWLHAPSRLRNYPISDAEL